jgi:hypothetical protein
MKPSLFLVGVALMFFVLLEPSSAQDLAFVGINVVPMHRKRGAEQSDGYCT